VASPATNTDPIPFPFSRIAPSRPPAGMANSDAIRRDEPPPTDFSAAGGWFGSQGTMVPILDAGPDGSGAAAPLPARGSAIGNVDSLSRFAPFADPSPAAPRSGVPVLRPAESREAELFADGAAHKVSELEAEMSRLLGELSSDARSS
jgi:hypothetical protein